jgi:hypothetical protein
MIIYPSAKRTLDVKIQDKKFYFRPTEFASSSAGRTLALLVELWDSQLEFSSNPGLLCFQVKQGANLGSDPSLE